MDVASMGEAGEGNCAEERARIDPDADEAPSTAGAPTHGSPSAAGAGGPRSWTASSRSRKESRKDRTSATNCNTSMNSFSSSATLFSRSLWSVFS